MDFRLHNLNANQINGIYILWTSNRGRKEWWETQPGMLETGRGLGVKHQNAPGRQRMDYFVQHFVSRARHIISQLVRNETTKTSAFAVVCGGGCSCWRRQNSECLLQHFVALFPTFHLILWWDRRRQRINYLLFTCFCNRVYFCCHVFASNNLEIFNNKITAISESHCTFI